jgi:putative transposase
MELDKEWLSVKEIVEITGWNIRKMQRKIKKREFSKLRQAKCTNGGGKNGKQWQIHISDPQLSEKIRRQFSFNSVNHNEVHESHVPLPISQLSQQEQTSAAMTSQTSLSLPIPPSNRTQALSVPAPLAMELKAIVSSDKAKVAAERLDLVRQVRKVKESREIGRGEIIKALAKEHNMSERSVYRLNQQAINAVRALPPEEQDDYNRLLMAQLLALVPKHRSPTKGTVKCFDTQALNYAKAIYLNPACLTLGETYRYLSAEARIHNWTIGCKTSLKNALSQIPPSHICFTREGYKKWEAKFGVKIYRDYTEIWPNFMWCGDHHIFDVFVKDFHGRPRRPWVTAWMDMRTRSFMGWCISFKPNSGTIALALRHAILPKENPDFIQHGLPLSVYIDNGKDYRAKYLNGDEISVGNIDYPEDILRFQALGIEPFYLDMEYDPTDKVWKKKVGDNIHTVRSIRVGGVYARLGINTHYATAYHPWAKPIERALKEIVQNFSRICPGWCGSGHEQRP